MLIEFTVENYRSIASRQTLSMEASNIREHEGAVIGPDRTGRPGLRLLPAVILYGPNASGKTNVLRAFHAMRAALVLSAVATERHKLWMLDPFAFGRVERSGPCSFEVRVLLDGDIYRYGFTASRDHVVGEWLYVRAGAPGSRERLLFSRQPTNEDRWAFGPAFRGHRGLLMRRTRASNGLALAKGAQESYEVLSQLFWTLTDGTQVNTHLGFGQELADPAMRANEDPAHLRILSAAACAADFGIKRLLIVDDESGPEPLVPPSLDTDWDVEGMPRFVAEHAANAASSQRSLDFQDESDGTRAFVAASSIVIDALRKGGLVVIDELDRSLHPLLTPLLVQLFQDPEVNRRGAQLIATTHDPSLLSAGVVRRDQVWFTQKNGDAETELFSLADFTDRGARADAALERRYLAGAFGAVPNPGNLKEAILRELESSGGPPGP